MCLDNTYLRVHNSTKVVSSIFFYDRYFYGLVDADAVFEVSVDLQIHSALHSYPLLYIFLSLFGIPYKLHKDVKDVKA